MFRRSMNAPDDLGLASLIELEEMAPQMEV
jgi:hypothetical protein